MERLKKKKVYILLMRLSYWERIILIQIIEMSVPDWYNVIKYEEILRSSETSRANPFLRARTNTRTNTHTLTHTHIFNWLSMIVEHCYKIFFTLPGLFLQHLPVVHRSQLPF